MKERQKFKLIKWNEQWISVATGVLFVSQLAVGSVNVMAETPDYVPASSLKNQNDTNQLMLGMSNAVVTGKNQKTAGNDFSVSQTTASNGTTRNGPSVKSAVTVSDVADLKNKINLVAAGGSAEFTWDGEIEIADGAIAIDGKNITLSSTNGATIKRADGYIESVFIVTEDTSSNKGSLTINGVNVNGNASNDRGWSLISVTQSTFTLKDGKIENGNGSYGAGISSTGVDSEVNIVGGIITNNFGINGGGISSEGIVNISGGTIKNNRSSATGGGVTMISGGVLTLSNGGKIIENTASTWGSGIFASQSTVNIEGGIISNNKPTTDGINSSTGGGISAQH